MLIKCPHCGKTAEKDAGDVNRARVDGRKVYCSRVCSGLGRRTNETGEEKKMIKYFYDRLIWFADFEKLSKKKHEAFKRDYAAKPEKYRKERQRRMKAHVEYCRRPEYKKYKKEYDVKYLAKKDYGLFWESALLLRELEDFLIENRPEGIKFQMGITNKTQKRKRLWQRNQKQKNSLQPI